MSKQIERANNMSKQIVICRAKLPKPGHARLRIVLLAAAAISMASAQQSALPGDKSGPTLYDPLQKGNSELKEATNSVFRFTFEERTGWEEKTGVSFGKAVNQQDMLSRLRIGAQFEPVQWFKLSAMGQDSRVPFYGIVAPNTMRDTMDLQEAYVELFAHRKTGFGASFGRAMINYGGTRVIGWPQWSNLARTSDHARRDYRTAK